MHISAVEAEQVWSWRLLVDRDHCTYRWAVGVAQRAISDGRVPTRPPFRYLQRGRLRAHETGTGPDRRHGREVCLADRWRTLVEDAVALRRDLHRHPELTWAERATAATIRDRLDALDIAWRECAGTGTVATLAAAAPGRHVALRGDIDAMPVREANGFDHASTVEGAMHACGHDGHTATLWATASWLAEHEAALRGPVTLLFQPAEEGGHGAKAMISDGALTPAEAPPVDVVFGWHNWPAIPFGQALCPDGTVMAGNGTFRIEVTGEGGHASQPETTRDPVLAAAAITVALQQVVARRLAPQQAAVVAVTSIVAPSAETVTPATATIGGSIRLADPTIRADLESLIAEVATASAAAYGVRADVVHTLRYEPTVNHPEPAAEFRAALADELGEGWHTSATPAPVMASEDFSYYLREIPGAFALVGADRAGRDEGRTPDGRPASCHSPHYDFDDALIPHVVRLYARLVGAPLPPTD